MVDMFETALSGDKKPNNGVKSGENPENIEVQPTPKQEETAKNSVNYTVPNQEKAPKYTRKVLADPATQDFLESMKTARQNGREEPEPPQPPADENPNYQDREATDQDFEIQDAPHEDDDPAFHDPEFAEDENVYQEEGTNDFTVSDEMIDNFVDMGVNYVNIYVPRLLAWLNEIENSEKFKAQAESIADIKKHATKFALKNKNLVIEMTPAQSLAFAVGLAYLPGILSGAIHRMPMILAFIANGFKSPKKPAPAPTHNAFSHVPSPKCGHPDCQTLVHQGQGYPKSSKKNPELVGKFCSLSHFKSYCNKVGITGTNSGGN